MTFTKKDWSLMDELAAIKKDHAGRAVAALNATSGANKGLTNMEWQPIETAPKDGTKVMGYCQPRHVESGEPMDFDYINTVWWRKEKFADSQWHWRHSLNDSAAEPTHWMPLPPPPITRA